ncbi:mitotic checkpoint regulator, MAD2B-interacting-domain-containing protein [Lactifluus volemus]|nr:mitotic checkpoint regulator, MAD2B-interacting-domain-containing protein [Lactifluus volemus]
MLVDTYGSDNSDNSDNECPPQLRSSQRQNKSTSLSLPASSIPSTSGSSTTLTLPAPKAKKAPKKITIDLPALPKDGSSEEGGDEARPAKRPRTDTHGAGSSTLFSMLPAPKLAATVKAAPERVLGSGKGPGLVFNNPPLRKAEDTSDRTSNNDPQSILEATENEHSSSLPFMPTSVRRGKANVSLEESSSKEAVKARDLSSPTTTDIFSLSASHCPLSLTDLKSYHYRPYKVYFYRNIPSNGTTSSLNVSSAPKIEDYTPPEPTPDDPYPGYYQLPSGTWAAYDSSYYQQFYNKWKADYDRQVRALEKKEKGFEGADADDTQEINALREMEKAKQEIQEREERKSLTTGAGEGPEAPRMNIKGSKISKGARKRGQLASLLVEAYQNREVLEEKIAEGRRNRKEAGNKYGMPCSNLPTYSRRLTILKDFDVMETMPVTFMQADVWTSTHTSLLASSSVHEVDRPRFISLCRSCKWGRIVVDYIFGANNVYMRVHGVTRKSHAIMWHTLLRLGSLTGVREDRP